MSLTDIKVLLHGGSLDDTQRCLLKEILGFVVLSAINVNQAVHCHA